MFFVVGAAVPYILWAITKNGYTRSGSRKRVQSKSKWKTHPTRHHAIDWSRAYRTRLLALLWGKTTHRYTCRRLIIYFDVSWFSLDGSSLTGIRSGQDRGVKAPEEFCGGKRVFFTWSRCLPDYQQIVQESWWCCMVRTCEFVVVRPQVRMMEATTVVKNNVQLYVREMVKQKI